MRYKKSIYFIMIIFENEFMKLSKTANSSLTHVHVELISQPKTSAILIHKTNYEPEIVNYCWYSQLYVFKTSNETN